ncbi:hypothetical protein FAGKG844_640003 [Frankia sp. AgKG'84/4]|nr:hypothetical protein [Frankia sp. AgKG'84/4]MCL9794199.1 hypothetical protein [Frankia sp. AgKG'84/4]
MGLRRDTRARTDAEAARQLWRWFFPAQPHLLLEKLIVEDPEAFSLGEHAHLFATQALAANATHRGPSRDRQRPLAFSRSAHQAGDQRVVGLAHRGLDQDERLGVVHRAERHEGEPELVAAGCVTRTSPAVRSSTPWHSHHCVSAGKSARRSE